ncbi:uncharacterized protein LOC119382119 [Rhipicephalus sanguineus]|uniref:uncharacterized protein LOC119382119 n=1 Tax=Rhipicephalus sanguineus TaxID=34632 RepID=UPI0018946BA9|nr:uncharacterized protein LOC119382119 [Rhipicephalus sanguineus]
MTSASSATAHETGTSGCAAKYRKPKPPSISRGPTSSSSQPNEGNRMHQMGPSQPANTQAFPPLVAPAVAPQVSSWAGVAASQPLSPPAVDAPSPELANLRQQVAELQKQKLPKQLSLLTKQLAPQQQRTAKPPGTAAPVQAATPATSKPSPRTTCIPNNPPAPVADEPTPAVSGAPQAPLPTKPTQPSEGRVPRIEERFTRVEASINHLITNFSVKRIVVEVTQAIQAWAITQFQPKASRSRSSSVSSAGSAPRRRRKVATTTLPPDNPASVPLPASQGSERDMEDQI